MSKLDLRTLLNVLFHSLPVSPNVTNFLAPGTDRYQAGQRLDFRHRFLQLFDKCFPFFFQFSAIKANFDGNPQVVLFKGFSEITSFRHRLGFSVPENVY